MRKFKLVQTQLTAFCDDVIETNIVGEFNTKAQALDHLVKRGYKFDDVRGAYICGNTIHFPVVIEEPAELDIFDIGSFV